MEGTPEHPLEEAQSEALSAENRGLNREEESWKRSGELETQRRAAPCLLCLRGRGRQGPARELLAAKLGSFSFGLS